MCDQYICIEGFIQVYVCIYIYIYYIVALLEANASIPCNGREAAWEESSFCLLAEAPINLAKAGSHPAFLPAPASHTLTPCDWPFNCIH